MALKIWRNKGWYYKYKKQNIFYIDEGSGEVLVLIHGFPTCSWAWHKLWPELKKRFRLITLDMVGFGFSDKPLKYRYSIRDQANLFETILQDLGVKHAHVLAHDYGNSVTQELLARYLERKNTMEKGLVLQSACLLNGGLFPDLHHPLRIQKLITGPLGKLLSPFTGRRELHKDFEHLSGKNTRPSEDEIDEFWELLTFNGGTNTFHRLVGYAEERVTYSKHWLGALQKTDVPIRLLVGQADTISGRQMASRFADVIPYADVITLNDIGHHPQMEAPEAVLKHYLAFVNIGKEV
ncbi:alpha/beta hydrolase [Fulvivirgaceae bacterium BMA12]|uniref:Alpha/beta hydrolase n=1 Tax=Agaribacillus aureus TaxID=3051825 RepID=A0ABT8LGI9_9BACT|nr:alpha/beta hydrolase [Fulvivirgaceae bacterium BMA12]